MDPGHQVILEGALDNLVKDIRGDDLVNIRAGELRSERLEGVGCQEGLRAQSVRGRGGRGGKGGKTSGWRDWVRW